MWKNPFHLSWSKSRKMNFITGNLVSSIFITIRNNLIGKNPTIYNKMIHFCNTVLYILFSKESCVASILQIEQRSVIIYNRTKRSFPRNSRVVFTYPTFLFVSRLSMNEWHRHGIFTPRNIRSWNLDSRIEYLFHFESCIERSRSNKRTRFN